MPYDPRVCTAGDMFRDLLRHFLNCQELNLDLRDVVITYTPVATERVFHMDPWSTPWADIRRTFCDPDNTNFVVDVNLFARSEYEMDISILECDDPLPGTLLTAPIVDNSNAHLADDSAETTFNFTRDNK
jgi:hypothetical protein